MPKPSLKSLLERSRGGTVKQIRRIPFEERQALEWYRRLGLIQFYGNLRRWTNMRTDAIPFELANTRYDTWSLRLKR